MVYQVRSAAIGGFDTLVRRLGHNPLSLLDQLGLNSAILRDPEILMPYTRVAELLELAAVHCDDDTFGLQLGMSQGLHTIGPVVLGLAGQPSIRACLDNIIRLLYLHAQGVEALLIDLQESTLLRFTLHLPIDFAPTQLLDMSLSLCCKVLETLNGGRPLEMRLLLQRSASPATSQRYRSLFQRDVTFESAENELIINTADLSRPPQAEPKILQKYLQQNIARMDSLYPNALPQQVRHSIRQLLPFGECSAATVASLLGLHLRTLQQRLKADGTSFRALQDEVRKESAMDYLQHSNLSLTEIALQLGFSELAVFSRVFKGWTGTSPLQWRKQIRLDPLQGRHSP